MIVTEGVPEGCKALEQVEADGGNHANVIVAIKNKLATPSQTAKALRGEGIYDTISYAELADVAVDCDACNRHPEDCLFGGLMVKLSMPK